jgi:4-hydroxy-4-methyl-2-oxoglutarate aldolase
MDIANETLQALARISTPTLSNAIEAFNVRPRNHGFMSPEIRCLFPDMDVMVGYAVTARFTADQPAARPASRYEFWRHVLEMPEPRVLVLQDLDKPAGAGAFVGEIMASIHKRLGCVGVITDGYLRDVDEVRALGFHFFAAGVCVSHAYVDLVDYGGPVKVGGLVVRPGDLLHADKHGVLAVPKEIAPALPQAAQGVFEREQRILNVCRSTDFTLEQLKPFFD